jgi:predicted metal-dependent enzyme (double-stranded beta helix superfamily)
VAERTLRHGGPEATGLRFGDRRVIAEGGVLVLDEDAIHSVKNPSTNRLNSALHVYGGHLIGTAKTMWIEPDLSAQPFDLVQVIGS